MSCTCKLIVPHSPQITLLHFNFLSTLSPSSTRLLSFYTFTFVLHFHFLSTLSLPAYTLNFLCPLLLSFYDLTFFHTFTFFPHFHFLFFTFFPHFHFIFTLSLYTFTFYAQQFISQLANLPPDRVCTGNFLFHLIFPFQPGIKIVVFLDTSATIAMAFDSC